MALINFDVQSLPTPEKTNDFQPVPAGWYTAVINGAELKSTNAGTGKYIAVRYDITGPTHQGRVIFGNLNIENPNPTAERIGREQLGELMRAVGLGKVTDTDQLIGSVLSIKVAIKESEQYGAKNEVKGFKGNGGALPTPSAPAAQATGKAAPPWAKK